MQPRKHENTKKTDWVFFGSSCLRGCVLWFLSCVSLLVVAQSAAAQQPAQPTFRTGTRLIVETVTVKDKEGKPVEGLTAKDFTLTEDGDPQTITFVEFQRVEPDGAPAAAPVAA